MLSIKFIRENQELIKKSLIKKNSDVDLDEILNIDFKRRTLIQEVETLKANKNAINNKISLKKKENQDCSSLINEMKGISVRIKALDNDLTDFNNILNEKSNYIPNIVHNSVPIGNSEEENVVIKEWGEKPSFLFNPLSHLEIAESLYLLDFKRGAKMSGAAFALYTDRGSKLERSLINYMLDLHTKDHSYTELFPPFLVTGNSPFTTGNLPKFKEDMYYIENDDLYCIPTAEVPITNYYANEVIEELPAESNPRVIFPTPDGDIFTHDMAMELGKSEALIFINGHYKGIDQRIRDELVTNEVSIGDYVLTGGEVAAAILSDAVIRLIPGVISDETSALTDSFQDNLLAPPIYTRPSDYKGWKVPKVLLSGNEKLITEWRERKAIKKTEERRPDLFE